MDEKKLTLSAGQTTGWISLDGDILTQAGRLVCRDWCVTNM